ncbi:VirB8/TrbF family protein, partial [Burkholderia cepacia]|uniref:VirB8/TrbF family protein n=1 Tax=Burkholderia cepacia TaxID=292 RepID=UPI00270F018B|nr:hypothetical protein [Burkholderia cepacia]
IDRATPPSRLITFAETIDHHRRNPQITVHYAISPPKSEEEIASNPVGLYITHFARVEDF